MRAAIEAEGGIGWDLVAGFGLDFVGIWAALARLRAVSERPALAAARHLRADSGQPQAHDITSGRWSFGGGGTIEVEEGELTLGILLAGPEGASVEASLKATQAIPGTLQRRWFPELRVIPRCGP